MKVTSNQNGFTSSEQAYQNNLVSEFLTFTGAGDTRSKVSTRSWSYMARASQCKKRAFLHAFFFKLISLIFLSVKFVPSHHPWLDLETILSAQFRTSAVC